MGAYARDGGTGPHPGAGFGVQPGGLGVQGAKRKHAHGGEGLACLRMNRQRPQPDCLVLAGGSVNVGSTLRSLPALGHSTSRQHSCALLGKRGCEGCPTRRVEPYPSPLYPARRPGPSFWSRVSDGDLDGSFPLLPLKSLKPELDADSVRIDSAQPDPAPSASSLSFGDDALGSLA